MIFFKIVLIFILLQIVIYAQTPPLEKVKLQLQWKYQFQFAGFIMAKEMGYYKDVGLDVEMIEYQDADTMQELEEGHVDYAMSNALIAYKDKKLNNVTLLATYFQRSPLVLVTQPEIKSVLHLKDKTVMIGENDRLNSSLTILLDYFSITPQNTNIVPQSYNINDFIEKKVDAATAFRSNELFVLDEKKVPYNVIDPVEYGFTTNANNIFASHEKVKNNPQQVKNFLFATQKGWHYALEHIDEVAELIHTKYQPNKSTQHLAYEGRVTKELMLLNLYPIGEINKDFVLQNYKLLLKNDKIDASQMPDKIILDDTQKKSVVELTRDLVKSLMELIDYKVAITIFIFMFILFLLRLFWYFKMKDEVRKRSIVQKELEKSEQSYKAERDRNKLFLDTAEVLLIALDAEARVTMFNRKAEELLGYTEEELLGKVWFEIGVLPKEINEKVRQIFNSLMFMTKLSDEPVEHVLVSKSGKEVLLSFRNALLFDANNMACGILSSSIDITARVEAEKELQKQHDFLQKVINGIGSSIMVINKDYTVSLMNIAAKEMLDENLIDNPSAPKCYEVSHHKNIPCESSSHPCPLTMVIEKKVQTKVLHRHSSMTGEEKIVELTVTPLFDEQGEVYAVIEAAHDITELKQTQNKLKFQAEHDSLTGLPNRVLFIDRIKQSINNAKRYHEKIAVLFIDLDHFKEVNDSLGHGIGDVLLETVSQKLNNIIRKSDTVARLGGDEFAIIINHFNHIDVVTSVVQNIMHTLHKPLLIKEHEIYASLSIGISVYPNDGLDADTLIKNADAAMYKVKNSGRNNYQFYTADMTERAFERVVLETQLRQSIEKNQLQVYYQIQMNAKENTIIGMEALVRWNHPDMGLVSPAKFIPLAEDTGFILQLDTWVMKESIAQFHKWKKEGLNPGVLSLNLCILKLEQDGFIQEIKDMIKKEEVDTSWLSFEVTESQIMKNPDRSIEKLNELNQLGIKLSIDDFGTGHSSLSYLKKLPIDKLKIDQSFIRDIPHDIDDVEITKTIIAMAKKLKLQVIAEGVETQEQIDFLLENDCNEIQGYFFHKPSRASEVQLRLKA
ncbi:MAG: EAL domain-containing protein [Sulfurimonas sp.]|jgi:diguanylate cyclase (GGDEF)-like protein/PAS domain S-box-containing protein